MQSTLAPAAAETCMFVRANLGPYLFGARFRLLTMSPTPDLAASAKRSWHQFLETYEPLRGDLYRYCRHITRSPWDAEDLAQDSLARAFVTLAQMSAAPHNPRAWLFRIASNLWIDEMRGRRELPAGTPGDDAATEAPAARATREAAGTLL